MMDPRDLLRLEELLVERATQALDAGSERELTQLRAAGGGAVDENSFDLAAAAVELALLDALDTMPIDVRERLKRAGRDWERAQRNQRGA